MADKLKPGAALLGKPLAAPASASFTDPPSGKEGAATPRSSSYTLEAADIVAIGIMFLALAASVIAIMVAEAFVGGKVSGADAFKIISTCVGGSTLSGVVAALAVKKRP